VKWLLCLMQALLAVLCLCRSVSEVRRSDTRSQSTADAAPSKSPAMCGDRFGQLPIRRFALRSCAMCYVYLDNATDSRRLLPLPGHYEALARVDDNYTVTQVRQGSVK